MDKNFAVSTGEVQAELEWFDVCKPPFTLYGFYKTGAGNPPFHRLPEDVARQSGEGILFLNAHTAGGRVRFSTNSRRIGIRASMPTVHAMANMPLAGSAGFDLYKQESGELRWVHTFLPPAGMADGYEAAAILPEKAAGFGEYIVNFPLYNAVGSLSIGLERGALLKEGLPYRNRRPVIFFGSSITQGGCASHPGNSYTALISQKLRMDYVNFGFSGSCMGQQPLVQYIASQPMDAFVCDYDHNAPTPEHLEQTHFQTYSFIRAHHPDIPYIMISRPDFKGTAEDLRRRQIIQASYRKAVSMGDRHVYCLDGASFFHGNRGLCTVDGCHPNDLGFYYMAEQIGKTLQRALTW